jgi:hypothetical protein
MSIEITSASGPKISIASGITELDTIVKTEITLPIKDGSTVLCNITIAGVLNKGIVIPIVAIMQRYSQKFGTSPNPTDKIPHNTQESVIEKT